MDEAAGDAAEEKNFMDIEPIKDMKELKEAVSEIQKMESKIFPELFNSFQENIARYVTIGDYSTWCLWVSLNLNLLTGQNREKL